MTFLTGHILQLRVDSSVVDGFVSLIFDLLLLSICNILSQAICSHCNLYTVYDAQEPLSLHSTHVLYFGHGLVGPVRVSRILCFILSIATLSVIILGFSIKGRSDNTLKPVVYHSVVSIEYPPRAAQLDYENEYELGAEQTDLRPSLISRRLIAFSIMDRCQSCTYSHCAYMGISFTDEDVNSQLVPSWDTIAEWSHSSSVQCIMDQDFSHNHVSWRYKIEKTHADLKCDINSIQVPEEGSFMTGKPNGTCDLTLEDVRCYRRQKQGGPLITIHCAAVGKVEGGDRLQLITFPDSENSKSFQVTPFAMSIHNSIPSEQIEKYLDNVAFFSSLDLGPAYKLDLMAFSSVTYNKKLYQRNDDFVNVTEIDLRIAIPCIVILSLTAVVLCTVFMTTWFSVVHSKKRKHFNSFSTVSGILELLLPYYEALETNSSKKLFPPTIGILRGSLRLGVRRSLRDFILPDEKRIEEWMAAEGWT